MGNLLEITYEGTNKVKESKIRMLVHEYELFMMHDNESINEMFTRFTTIINSLEEAKDLTTLPLEQLLRSLMTHETTMMNHESKEIEKKIVALKVPKEENEDVSDEDEAMALITTQFKKFLKSQKGKKTFKKYPQKQESTKKEEVICNECNKPGHYKSDCPKLKKKEQFKKNKEQSKKKKAMVATWSDCDYSSSDEESDEEEENIALMAIENEEEDEV
ncbi:zf-CCHC domain-containing protein/UBN2 domain-containing protein [Cephalotus follicularis]|uniref:Zf-CCHC domain-containing protein/UBN2 domain-containing protein n=1 Tax=Cephalotus follicularis TaxID=3775 RepID=A0A1Q3AU15_CEPFO|nr:zf-CCHC domain-containing protein/UBN2 domain-containing protein [Cephalotus follicularis]